MKIPSATFLTAILAVAAPAVMAQTLYVPNGTSGISSTASNGGGNSVILGTAAKSVAPTGMQGEIQIWSSDASNPLQAWVALITDPTAANRRLSIGAIEQNIAFRNVTLAENGGFVGIGTSGPLSPLSVSGQVVIGDPYRGDASLHISKAYGGYGRLTQMYPSGPSQDALNLMASTDANSNYNWWSWGVRAGNWTINPGTAFATGFTMTNTGNVGIGTTSPSTRLTVYGTLTVDAMGQSLNNYTEGIRLGAASNGYSIVTFGANPALPSGVQANQWWIGKDGSDNGFDMWSASSGYVLHILASGNVGIGTMNPGTYKLAVAGVVHAQEVVVDMIGWSDYVFDEHYKLAPLSEVEAHIKAEKHLPGIPSASDVAAQGISVGEMQAKLLAKIEELTLHQIEQEKEIRALRAENTELRTEIHALAPVANLN